MFFAGEQQAIDKKQEDVANCEANLEDIVEQILESVDYEPEEPAEGEEAKEIKHTPKLAHEQLAVAIKGCEEDSDDAKELEAYSAQLKECEDALKAAKSELDQLQKTLDLHLELKCLGVESKKLYAEGLLNQANNEIAEVTQHATALLEQSGLQFCIPSEDASIETILVSLDEIKKSVPSNKNKRTAEQNTLLTKVAQAKDVLKEPKKKFTKLQKEVVKIQQVLSGYDATMQSIGGQITEEETRTLILQKHYNIIADQLNRYTEQEKREVISACEHLYDKYAMSAQQIAADRDKVMTELNDILKKLKYVD
jgi:type I restriction enzyme M protein